MASIFLSYAGLNRDIAAQVADGLKTAGVDVWWDRQGIGWGDEWIEKLQEELTKCGAYVIMVGSSGVRKWVKAELSVALKRHVEQDLPIFPLLLPGVGPDSLPPFLSTIQVESLPERLDHIDYKALAERLSSGVLGPTPISPSPVLSDVCPFPGLEAFGEKDALFFVGRQKETLDAVRYLGLGLDGVYRRWLQVEGTSGVGKSSLVKAGIIPAIKKGWVGLEEAGTRQRWRVVGPMRPGTDPILNLATALSKGLSHGGRTLSAIECNGQLQGNDTALKVGLRDWVPEAEAMVLIIDQLEEIFTHPRDGGVRQRFDALLANALDDQDGSLHLITTIRSDFMMQFAALPHLQALLNEKAHRYFLAPMGEHGLNDVVRTPARLAGLQWSDDQLPADIVQEARGEQGALPLVENLLRLLWLDARREKRNTLSRAVYRQLGGVGGALANSADALLDSLGSRKHQALDLLLALVNVGGQDIQDTRRTITESMALEAAGGGAEAKDILNQLSGLRGRDTADQAPARPRLLVLSSSKAKENSTDLVDLAHETLLRYDPNGKPYWKTLRDQITKKRREIESRQLAEALAKEWRDNGSPRWSGLATGVQVKAFRRLHGLTEDGTAYVQASRMARWIRAGVMGLVFCLVGVVGAWLWKEGVTIEDAFLTAQSNFMSIRIAPKMETISGGTFRQRDTYERGNKDEQPVQNVTIKQFAMGKFEVTFDEYKRFAIATKRLPLPYDRDWGRGRRPVINVSWDDAKAYAAWLSQQTGKSYRLPTESEWEYAARSIAKNKDDRWAGTSNEEELKDYAVYNTDRTEPVGSRKPNGLGLYDMSGNVWEWVEDCWHETYKGAPRDGSAWLEADGGDCGDRVIRGGSWFFGPVFLRSSNRFRDLAVYRDYDIGFRLVQDIP